jgi:SAM-dependent methyltransferase
MKREFAFVSFIEEIIKQISIFYRKRSILELLSISIVFFLIIFITYNNVFIKEGLESHSLFKNKFLHLKNNKIYDTFYASIYDNLFFDRKKLRLELNETISKTNIDNTSSVLDIGSGTGHHLNVLHEIAGEVTGIDNSKSMVEKAKQNYPFLNIKQEDALNTMVFMQERFSHITLFYFTIYCFEDKLTLLQNCYKWLKQDGYLIVHLVNRDKFDPLLNHANPLYLVSPQKYAKKRMTKSSVNFNTFKYKSNFEYETNKDITTFKEVLKCNKSGNTRVHEHELHLTKQKEIIQLAKKVGFGVKGKIHLLPCQYEYQYIYILQK